MVHTRLLGINSLMQPACNSRSNRRKRRRRRFFIIFMTHFHGPARAEGAQRPFKRLVNDEAAEVCAVRSAPRSALLYSFHLIIIIGRLHGLQLLYAPLGDCSNSAAARLFLEGITFRCRRRRCALPPPPL